MATPSSIPIPPSDPDTRKRALEEVKLGLEIAELERKSKRRIQPEYFSAMVALVIGSGTFAVGAGSLFVAQRIGLFDVLSKQHDADTKLLLVQQHDLQANVEQFQRQKDDLHTKNSKLEADGKKIRDRNAALEKANEFEQAREAALKKERRSARAEARLAGFRARVDDLSGLNEFSDGYVKAMSENVIRTLFTSGSGSPEEKYATETIADDRTSERLKFALLPSLIELSGDVKLKKKAIDQATQFLVWEMKEYLSEFPSAEGFLFLPKAYSEDLTSSAFEIVRKFGTKKDVGGLLDELQKQFARGLSSSTWMKAFTSIRPDGPPVLFTAGVIFPLQMAADISTWDLEASAQSTGLWMETLATLTKMRDAKVASADFISPMGVSATVDVDYTIGSLNPQCALVRRLIGLSSGDYDYHLPKSTCPPSEELAALGISCRSDGVNSDLFPSSISKPEWAAGHPRLVALWTSENMDMLRKAPREIIRKAVMKQWITEEELARQ